MKALIRSSLRIALSSYATNGLSAALGLLAISSLVDLTLGPVAAAAATVGVIVVTPADQVAPKHGKFTHLLPAALIGTPLFLAVLLMHRSPGPLWLLLTVATFLAFLGAAWGKRGLPVSMSVMFAMIFSLAAPAPSGLDNALAQTGWFALGAGLYLVWGTAANALLNARYRTLVLVDSLFAVAALMRTQAQHFAAPHATEERQLLVGRLMKEQAALADQLQSARNVLLESPRTPRRQQLAGMLLQVLEMRDHLVASALDLDAVHALPRHQALLGAVSAEIVALAADVETLADALLLGRTPARPPRARPPLAPQAPAPGPAADLLVRSMLGRVAHLHEEVDRLIALARREQGPDLDVVRVAWQMFVSPTTWSWRPLLSLWRWDAPPLRHAIRAALAIGVAQAGAMALPWGTHEYWILLTIVVVLRGSLAQTLERRNSRVAGTLLGCALAGALLYAKASPLVLLLAVTLGQGIAHAFAVQRYIVTAVAATVLALVQAHLLNPGASPVFEVAERLADTGLGVLLAWGFSYVLPSWERTQVGALVARALAAQTRHAQLALALGRQREAGSRVELGWRLARREAYDSLSALVQAIQRSLSEPRAVRPPVHELERMLAHHYQLLAQLTAIKTMLLHRRDRLDLQQLQAPLQEAATAITQALAGGTARAPRPAADDAMDSMLNVPDPLLGPDLTPWLLRRLHLSVGIAHELRAEASEALEKVAPAG